MEYLVLNFIIRKLGTHILNKQSFLLKINLFDHFEGETYRIGCNRSWHHGCPSEKGVNLVGLSAKCWKLATWLNPQNPLAPSRLYALRWLSIGCARIFLIHFGPQRSTPLPSLFAGSDGQYCREGLYRLPICINIIRVEARRLYSQRAWDIHWATVFSALYLGSSCFIIGNFNNFDLSIVKGYLHL